jgi:hypothetical protein
MEHFRGADIEPNESRNVYDVVIFVVLRSILCGARGTT